MKIKIPTHQVLNSMRRDWNGVNPVTKIIPDKKKQKNKKTCRKKVDF